MLHPLCRNAIWRASCNGTEIRLSIQRESGAVLKIKRPGISETRVEIDIADVGATVEEFQAIGEDPEKFKAFVNAAESSGYQDQT
jgi:hypothetical protein